MITLSTMISGPVGRPVELIDVGPRSMISGVDPGRPAV
jgi:hypothetical protein